MTPGGLPAGSAHHVRIWLESLREAARTIADNPLRATLATLAIAAAVATTSLVVTALEAVERSARETSARAFGADTFVIARLFPGQLGRRELARLLERNPPIRRPDVAFLERWTGDRVLYAPAAQQRGDVVTAGAAAGSREFEGATLSGTSATLERIRELPVADGRFLRPHEDDRAALVAVLGADVAERLFPAADPVGRAVRIAGRRFRIVGVQSRQGTAGGTSLDRYVWLPLSTYERVLGRTEDLQLFARAAEPDDPTARQRAEDLARFALRARRRLGPGEPDNFGILRPEAARGFVETLTRRVGAAGPPISAMALLAAVVVVTNTILVSVAQRTRELGIRRAVGAARRHIIAEVLAESAILGVLGGTVGLAAAAGLLSVAAGFLGVALPLRAPTLMGSLIAATGAGLLAGWYPARRAAAIDVTRALHED